MKTGESLNSVLKLHVYKQNEKHPCIYTIRIWKGKCEYLSAMGKMEMKMADFQNHRRLSLRCLSKDIIPVSVKLKSNAKMPKGNYIVRKAERAVLNERVRSIKNIITMFMYQIDTHIDQIKAEGTRKGWKIVIYLSRIKGDQDT